MKHWLWSLQTAQQGVACCAHQCFRVHVALFAHCFPALFESNQGLLCVYSTRSCVQCRPLLTVSRRFRPFEINPGALRFIMRAFTRSETEFGSQRFVFPSCSDRDGNTGAHCVYGRGAQRMWNLGSMHASHAGRRVRDMCGVWVWVQSSEQA